MNQSARSLLTLLAGCSQQAFLLQELLDKDRERVERKQALASLCQVLRLAQKKKRVRELHRKQALFQFRLVIKRVAEKKDALENEKLRAISRLVRAIQKGTDVKNAFDPWKATNRELTEGIWRTKDLEACSESKKPMLDWVVSIHKIEAKKRFLVMIIYKLYTPGGMPQHWKNALGELLHFQPSTVQEAYELSEVLNRMIVNVMGGKRLSRNFEKLKLFELVEKELPLFDVEKEQRLWKKAKRQHDKEAYETYLKDSKLLLFKEEAEQWVEVLHQLQTSSHDGGFQPRYPREGNAGEDMRTSARASKYSVSFEIMSELSAVQEVELTKRGFIVHEKSIQASHMKNHVFIRKAIRENYSLEEFLQQAQAEFQPQPQ